MVKLYNTMTRKKEELKTLNDREVRIYSCGPTVYNYVHIGNLRAFITADLLRRWLKYKGYEVIHVMNITDVDDKTIKGVREEGISLKKYTEKYEKAFFKDIQTLNIQKVENYPRATEYIPAMVELVQKLLDKGIAYKSEDGSVYYDISKFEEYGKLAHLDPAELREKICEVHEEYDKKHPHDFVLWKAWKPEDGEVYWETSLGKGRPGWHIECSSMSMKYLGETLDIHTGGVDLIFPHHQNEIAQSEGATGKKFVKYWVHNEHLIVEGEKMSKSLGNFYTLRDLLDKGYSPRAIRWVLLTTHYRKKLDFTFQDLKAATSTLLRLDDFLQKLDDADGKGVKDIDTRIFNVAREFEEAMDDDLNINKAIAVMFDFVHEINKLITQNKLSEEDAKSVKALMRGFDLVLGVMKEEQEELSEEDKKLIEEREKARKNKEWEKADKIREELREKGIILQDTEEGVKWKKI